MYSQWYARNMGSVRGDRALMKLQTKNLIEANQKDLDRIHDQRRLWLWASSVVFWALIFIIFAWDWIDGMQSKSIWWVIVSCMLILSINWWYWTMRVIRRLVNHQATEYDLLQSILHDLSSIKQDVRDLNSGNLDKPK